MTMNFKTLEWKDQTLLLLNQRVLPQRMEMVPCRTVEEVAERIGDLTVRGAPAIGVAAAYGMVLAANQTAGPGKITDKLERAAKQLKESRPTAVNLGWAVDRMLNAVTKSGIDDPSAMGTLIELEAVAIHNEDIEMCRQIGRHGAELLTDGMTVLTHCNAGALATTGIGTALAAIYTAKRKGKNLQVYVDETRPVLQGARLTMWELIQNEIDATLITDNTAASLFAAGKINAVIVGADRIAKNGDVANKIGTYNLAVLAAHHKVPFYVAAPRSTFDDGAETGAEIPIEERSAAEVLEIGTTRIAPASAQVYCPAFDVTPNAMITAIVSDEGVTAGGRV